MKTHPMLFSTPMVLALLAGRKTQTRRILNPQPLVSGDRWKCQSGNALFQGSDINELKYFCENNHKYKIGDLIWVRETWQALAEFDKLSPLKIPENSEIIYTADRDDGFLWDSKKRPSIFMPRWASRLTLKVTDVRVERLQDISGEDAVAEGVRSRLPDNGIAQQQYFDLWDAINGAGASALNPFVVALTFEVIKQNIDQYLREAA